MSLLGHMTTKLGDVELRHGGGVFVTRRVFDDSDLKLFTGEATHISVVPLDRERAQRWYELMQREGVVYTEFPERPVGVA
jgi:hypothetical protein